MGDELLTAALCWELDGRVPVEYAHAQPSLTFHCLDPACLAKVVPVRIRNVFFRAPGRHACGCRWEKETVDNTAAPGVSRPKPSPLLPAAPPTYLGAGPAIRRRLPPTVAQLRQLAVRAEHAPIMHPGTLHDVVNAWCDMNTADRLGHPLVIAGHTESYATAFRFLPQMGPDISTLGSDRHIIFSGAKVTLGAHLVFVTTLKKFNGTNGFRPISIGVSKGSPSAAGLAEAVDASVTVFWHGPVPTEDREGRYFSVRAPDETIYDGLIVKNGHRLP